MNSESSPPNLGILYAKAMGVVLSTVYGLRSTVHLTDHTNNSIRKENEDVFIKYWKEWLDNPELSKLHKNDNKDKALFHYILNENGNDIKEFDFASWRVPCSENECRFYLDLPIPLSIGRLKNHSRISFTNLFSRVLMSEISQEWHASAMLQSTITMALGGIPHYSIIYYLQDAKKNPIAASSHKWFSGEQKEMFNKLSSLNDNVSENYSIKSIDRAEMIEILFGKSYKWDKTDNENENLYLLQKLLIWDRIGQPANFEYPEFNKIDSLLDNKEFIRLISNNRNKALLNFLPSNANYFLAALGLSDKPAFLLSYKMSDSNFYNEILVPNFSGLYEFLEGVFSGKCSLEKSKFSWPGEEKGWNELSLFLYNTVKIPQLISEIFKHPKFGDLQNDQEYWSFKEICKSNYSSDKKINKYNAADTIFYIPIDKHGFDCYENERSHIVKNIIETKNEIQTKLNLKENQLWITRIRYENDGNISPVFDFILPEVIKDKLVKTDISKSNELETYVNYLIEDPPKPTGVVGETYRSLKFSQAISVLGDFRTMEIMGANDSIKKYSDLMKDKGTIAETELYARHFRDFYSFPIFVSQRLWGLLEIADRSYHSDSDIDILEEQFRKIWEGSTAAIVLGQFLEKLLVDAAEVVLLHRLSMFLKDPLIDNDEKITKNLQRIFAKVLYSLPFVEDINYNLSCNRDENHLIEEQSFKGENLSQNHFLILDKDQQKYKIELKAFVPIGCNNLYEAKKIKKVFQSTLNDFAEARRANIDAAIGAEARQYNEVKDDINNLIQLISDARLSAVKIEENLSSTKSGFLKMYPEIQNIFRPSGRLYYCKVECNLIDDPRSLKCGTNNVHFIDCFHDFEETENPIEKWNRISFYLNNLAGVTNIHFYNSFGEIEVPEEVLKKKDDEMKREFEIYKKLAEKQFNLLKILVHLSQRNEPIYFIQLLASCIAPIENKDESLTLIIKGKQNTFRLNKWETLFNLLQNSEILDEWVDRFKKLKSSSIKLRPTKIMSAIMDLIGIGLKRGQKESNKVYLNNINIEFQDSFLDISINCHNKLRKDSIQKITSLDEDSYKRGLRLYLKIISESVGQSNPVVLETNKISELKECKVMTNDEFKGKFIIGSNGDETIFFIRYSQES